MEYARNMSPQCVRRLEQGTLSPDCTLSRSAWRAKQQPARQQRGAYRSSSRSRSRRQVVPSHEKHVDTQQFRVRSIESHHVRVSPASAGMIIGVNIVGPHASDVQVGDVLSAGQPLRPCANFTALVQVPTPLSPSPAC